MDKQIIISIIGFGIVIICFVAISFSSNMVNQKNAKIGNEFCNSFEMEFSKVPYKIAGDAIGSCKGYSSNNIRNICNIGVNESGKVFFYDSCDFVEEK